MAIVISGPYVGFSGTIDGLTFYQLPDGRTVVKIKNSPSETPPTEKQLAVKKDTQLFSKLLKPLRGFVLVGFELEAKIQKLNPNNAMVKTNRKNSIEGTYPNRSVNCSKILMTKGSLPSAENVAAEMNDSGLTFSWSTEIKPRMTHHSDQVMMLAYFPERKEARYMTAGAQRLTGTDFLPLDGIKKGCTAEVYLSFVSGDRKNIADSIYVGQFNW